MSSSFLTFSSFRCNIKGSCSCVLPVIESKSSVVHHIRDANDRTQAREYLRNRPNSSSCLLVSSRNSAGLKQLLQGSMLLKTFESSSAIGTAMNLAGKPSPILAFQIPADSRVTTQCQVLADGHVSRKDNPDNNSSPASTFKGQAHGKILSCLFDSGATACFVLVLYHPVQIIRQLYKFRVTSCPVQSSFYVQSAYRNLRRTLNPSPNPSPVQALL